MLPRRRKCLDIGKLRRLTLCTLEAAALRELRMVQFGDDAPKRPQHYR